MSITQRSTGPTSRGGAAKFGQKWDGLKAKGLVGAKTAAQALSVSSSTTVEQLELAGFELVSAEAVKPSTTVGELTKNGENLCLREVPKKLSGRDFKLDKYQQEWLPLAAFPTALTRTTPFFPLAAHKMPKEQRVFFTDVKPLKVETSWGSIEYIGPQLSVYDEDVLLAVLVFMHLQKVKGPGLSGVVVLEGRASYEFHGPVSLLLKALSLSKDGRNHKRILDSLSRLELGHFHMSVGKKKGSRRLIFTSLFDEVRYDEDKKLASIRVNRTFYEEFGKNYITQIDTVFRSRIRSPVAKALFRFVQSHEKIVPTHFEKIAAAINLDLDQPAFHTRRVLKRAIENLKAMAYLTQASGFSDKNTLHLERSASFSPPPKSIPEK